MSRVEQIIELQCLSLLEDGHPQSFVFVKEPTDNEADGTVLCKLCNVTMPQTNLLVHTQGHHLWCVSSHRSKRHTFLETRPDVVGPIEFETHEQSFQRWKRTLSLATIGPFVVLEGGVRVYCQKCEIVLPLPDTASVIAHMKTKTHKQASGQNKNQWVEEAYTPAMPMGMSIPKGFIKKVETNLRRRVPVKHRRMETKLLFGCSMEYLCYHIQKQFTENINYSNYGSWSIDHIVPVSAYQLDDPVHCMAMCHYSNLQPLWGHENLLKGNKM